MCLGKAWSVEKASLHLVPQGQVKIKPEVLLYRYSEFDQSTK